MNGTKICTSRDTAAAQSADLVLDVDRVTVKFGGVTALDAVNLGVRRGEVHGLIGPNGAGKTTLFDVISGIRSPSSGQVRLGAVDVTRRRAVWRARHGMRRTFQRQQIFGGLTVYDNLLVAQEWNSGTGGVLPEMLGVSFGRRGLAKRRIQVDEVLELCGLEPVRNQYAASLPIGMARLVELGRAIVDPPLLLLLDEPSSGLGETEQHRLSDTIARIRGDGKCGVLLVEHDMEFVMSHCDRISVLDLGRVIAEGPPAQVSESEAVRKAYLG